MIKIEKTNHTPEVIVEKGIFKMTGICTPENPPRYFLQFQEELMTALSENKNYELAFHLDYFNTGASKCLLNLFKAISEKAKNSGVKITWMYEKGDEEMKESGELFAEITEMEFSYHEIN